MSSAGVNPEPELADTSRATKPPTSLPTDPDMSAAATKLNSRPISLPVPSNPKTLSSKADEILERLNKLIKTTAGLGSLLSTLSYLLYIVAYLDAASPSRQEIVNKISAIIGRTPSQLSGEALKKAAGPPVSRFAPWIGLLNDTRFALRLTGLLPMYMLLKSVIKNPPKDTYLRTLAQIQVACYITFQLYENLWYLASKSLLSPTTVNRLGGSQKLLTNSCRPWFVAITCDFLKLYREAQLDAERKSKGGQEQLSAQEQKAKDDLWYSQLFVACSWYPMAIHYSKDGGIGLNTGLVGLCGAMAGSVGFRKLWAATID